MSVIALPPNLPARRVFSVSAVVNRAAQVIRERAPPLWVRGEVSGWKRYRSGHCYFTLKDDKAELCCIIWDRTARLLPALPNNGMEVDVFGQLTIYPRRGQFQLEVMEVAATGIGGLWQVAKERLIAQLRAEGLLDEDRKRPLPELPERVGIVTSAQSAVLHDMHRSLRRRAWWIPVVVSHTTVEGAGAAEEVAQAIRRLGTERDRCPVDVVIVARGGGSMESLWGFNMEPVARAIATCPVPVISAVGHETDYTVADMVADHRAATPTAGAERAVPDGRLIGSRLQAWPGELRRHLMRSAARRDAEVESQQAGIRSGAVGRLRFREVQLVAAERHLEARSPRRSWLRAAERIEAARLALSARMEARLEAHQRTASGAEAGIHANTAHSILDAARRLETADAAIRARSPRFLVARAGERVAELEAAIDLLVRRRLHDREADAGEVAASLHARLEGCLAGRERLTDTLAALVAARSPYPALRRLEERVFRMAADLDEGVWRRIRAQEQRVTNARSLLDRSILERLHGFEQESAAALDAVDARSPLRVLARGYAVVTDPHTDRPIRSVRDVLPDTRLRVRLADGALSVRVDADPLDPGFPPPRAR